MKDTRGESVKIGEVVKIVTVECPSAPAGSVGRIQRFARAGEVMDEPTALVTDANHGNDPEWSGWYRAAEILRVGKTPPVSQHRQGKLFGPMPRTLARSSDPTTSNEAAAEVVADGTVGRQSLAVLEALRKSGARTSAELAAEWSGFDRYVAARRLPELESQGMVRRIGTRACAITKRIATVWEVYP